MTVSIAFRNSRLCAHLMRRPSGVSKYGANGKPTGLISTGVATFLFMAPSSEDDAAPAAPAAAQTPGRVIERRRPREASSACPREHMALVLMPLLQLLRPDVWAGGERHSGACMVTSGFIASARRSTLCMR